MIQVERLAEIAIDRDALLLRDVVMQFLRENPTLSSIPQPKSEDRQLMATAAGLLELLASRRNQVPPEWTSTIGASPLPLFLVAGAQTMPRLRQMCLDESPPPLKLRQLYAPPDFLSFA